MRCKMRRKGWNGVKSEKIDKNRGNYTEISPLELIGTILVHNNNLIIGDIIEQTINMQLMMSLYVDR